MAFGVAGPLDGVGLVAGQGGDRQRGGVARFGAEAVEQVVDCGSNGVASACQGRAPSSGWPDSRAMAATASAIAGA